MDWREESGTEPYSTGVPASEGAYRRRFSVEFDLSTFVAVAVGVTALLLIFAIGSATGSVLLLIGIGAILALALDPLVGALQQRLQVRRLFAVLIVGGAFLAVATFVVVVMGPPAIRQAETFSKELPETVEQMYSFPVVGDRLERADAANKVEEWAHDLPAELDDKTLGDITRSVLGGVLSAFQVAILAFVLLLDGESMVVRVRRAIPPARRDQVDRIGRVFYRVFGRYFAGSLLVAIIAGLVVLAIGLALGVPLAPLAALWMVLVDLIPQIGGLLGGSVFVLLAVTKDLPTGIICLVLFIIYNTLENHVLQPAIVGQSVDLSPPTTMMAALIGGAALGVPGALVATPVAGTIKVLYSEIRYGTQPDPKRTGLIARWRARRSHEI
jgi:predicted PurR-regulated permease PerM